MISPSIGKYVVVRTYSAGVHVGILESKENQSAILSQTRRIWYWEGAFTLSAVAKNGITGGKISTTLDSIEIEGVIEVIPTTEVAEKSLREIKEHIA